MATKVNPMGYPWAAFLAHTTLETVFEDELADESAAILATGAPIKNFTQAHLLYWLSIDDYAGVFLADSAEQGEQDALEFWSLFAERAPLSRRRVSRCTRRSGTRAWQYV